MPISALNFFWLVDPHDLQGMSNHIQIFATFLFTPLLIYCGDHSSAVMSVTEICDKGLPPRESLLESHKSWLVMPVQLVDATPL
jgi:hypothetical protein